MADILMGTPLGASHRKSRARSFIRDPNGILVGGKPSEAFDPHAQIPADAEDTRFRQDGLELWMRSGDDSVVYLVGDADVEAWPQVQRIPGCA